MNASLEKKRLRDEQRKLFRTFATKEVADELLKTGFSLGGKYVNASVMFADIRSFTSIGEKQDPADTIELLNNYFALMFDAIIGNNGTVNQLEGDGLMAIFGAPIHHEGHREHAVRAALEMIELLKGFNVEQAAQNKVADQDWHWDCHRQGDRRLYRHTTSRHLYLCWRYGQSRCTH